MRSDLSDVPTAIKKLHPQMTQEKFDSLKTNLLFLNQRIEACEDCYFNLKDVFDYTKNDMKALLYRGRVKYKLVSSIK